jgi:hypothetical protein
MEVISCEGKSYYREEDLKDADKAYFYGCSRSRSIIEKKSIPDTEYVFAILKKKTGNWEIKNKEYKPAKLLVSTKWAHHFVPVLRPLNKEEESSEDKEKQESTNMSSMEAEEKVYQMAPPILELEDDEKFKDKDGNVLEIEVRGERHHKKCYFLVKDVVKAFNLSYLDKTIQNTKTEYEEGKHYCSFIRSEVCQTHPRTNKSLFLTYVGILKVLFGSRSKIAEDFQEWATEKLFTIQMGEQTQKDELAGELIGVSSKTIQDVFRKNTDKTPCIYLLKICDAQKMFPEKNYRKEDIICKFGFTDDLPRRTKEHNQFFGKQKNICPSVQLICFSIIDPKFLCDAERNLSTFFKRSSISYGQQTELICINTEELKDIKKQYSLIQRSFLGCYKEMAERINKLESEALVSQERHQKELLEMRLQLQEETNQKNILKMQLEKHKSEMEIERLKRELLEMRLSQKQINLKDK